MMVQQRRPGGSFPPGAPIVLSPAERVALDMRIDAERMCPVDQFDLPQVEPGERVVIMTATGEILPWEFADMAEWWRAAAYRLVGGWVFWFVCEGCDELADCNEDTGLCSNCSGVYDEDYEL